MKNLVELYNKKLTMQQVFAHEFMHQNRGCYGRERLDGCSFMKGGAITLDRILRSEISLKDKYWFVCKKLATTEENRAIAIRTAEIVLPIYEGMYPDNKAPRECIEAVKAFLAGTIGIGELLKKREAVSYASSAVSAASYASSASASYAVSAASYAVSVSAADIKAELHNYLLTFIRK